jgi:hypothetical protein
MRRETALRNFTPIWNAVFVAAVAAVIVTMTAGCVTEDEPQVSTHSAAVAGSDRLLAGEILLPGQAIGAGSTILVYQDDNNLVLYRNGAALWATMAGLGATPNYFAMQGDCNAVVYSTSGYVWASWTNGRGSQCYARVTDGQWFVCSGTNRVFSARGGGDCGDGKSTTGG